MLKDKYIYDNNNNNNNKNVIDRFTLNFKMSAIN